nr:zinc finger, CCHC-type [Tanacetum cinerariifolium]
MEQGTDSIWSKSQERSNRLRCYICQSEEHLKRDCPRECRVRGTCKVPVQMRDGSSFMLNNVRQEQAIKGSLVVSSGTRRANCVYTLDSQAVTIKTLKARKKLGEYHTRWKINMVAIVAKIYAHESLTFNDMVSCEVISKWKTGLIEEMDARSDVYVLNNGCKKSSDDKNDYYWEMHQMDVHGFMNFDYAMGRSITRYRDGKEATWLKGLLTESETELKLVAVVATGAFIKAGPWFEIPA